MRRAWLFIVVVCVCVIMAIPARAEQMPRRGFFVSLIQKPIVFSSRQEIARLITDAKASGVQTLFVQVYYGGRAVFKTKHADTALYEAYLQKIGNDSFAVLIKEAHAAGLQVHAWLNLLSLAGNDKALFIKTYGPEILTRNVQSKKDLEDYKIDSQFFLEPGDPRVRQTLGLLVSDLLRAYPDLDGIQFDYIRYPDTKPMYGYTKANMDRFLKASQETSVREDDPKWKQWKRRQVSEVVEFLVERIRKVRPKLQISTTGCMPYARAYHEAFQDWPMWVNTGLVDFVTIMNYATEPDKFERWSIAVKEKLKDPRKMNIAIGAYKLADKPEIFVQEWKICEALGAGSCVVFHYGDLLTAPALMDVLLAPSQDKKRKRRK